MLQKLSIILLILAEPHNNIMVAKRNNLACLACIDIQLLSVLRIQYQPVG